jgi:site-specific recombinase XerD
LQDGVVLQPVALLRQMRALRVREGSWRTSAPLFQWGGRAMSETAVNKLLRAALHAAGVPHAHTFSSHSLRVGGATAAMAVGVDPESIKVLGRWDSMAYKMYTRLSQQAARRVGVAVASAAVDF